MIRLITASILAGLFSVSAMAESSQVTYTVPTPANLAAYATFPINAQYTVNGDDLEVSYTLPQDLTGTPIAVTMHGNANSPTLQGPNAQATCSNSQNLTSCKINYTDLPLNLGATEQYLNSKYTNATGLNYRTQVAAIFNSEPVGIISFPSH